MRLSPREEDHLVLHAAGVLAQKRLARGLRLNYTESVALLATQVLEFIRDGKSVAELMALGTQLLGRRHVLDGVAEMLDEVQVEGTFPDGTKLVTVHHPIATMDGNLELALYGSFLPVPSADCFPLPASVAVTRLAEAPGAVLTADEELVLNGSRQPRALEITNLTDRPIQVGSHYHLIEANPYLEMDRKRAYGYRLNIPSGTAVRFEPGDRKTVSTVPIGGNRVITGGNNLASGVVDVAAADAIVAKAVEKGFHHAPMVVSSEEDARNAIAMVCRMPRSVYAQTYGPTTGDVVRLGDMELYVTIERDMTVYGDECKFGGGKVLREGMGQASGLAAGQVLDTIITNALILDYTGIYKADIGIKDGLIAGIGKGGNPDVMDGVLPNMIVGVNTEVIAGEGLIVTAGGMDAHVHFICPQLCTEALASGLTTLVGGGTGPATGTNATTCTPGPAHMKLMLQATDVIPINIGLTGKGNTSMPEGLQDIIDAGAVGMKLHEGLGHDARRDRYMPHCRRGERCAGDDPHGHAERVLLRRAHDRGVQRTHDPHVSQRRRRRRPRARHHLCLWGAQRPAVVHESHAAVHGQHDRRACGYADGVPPLGQEHRGRRRVRRVSHPWRDDRRRRPAARHGRHQHHLVRLAGHGPHRRSRHAHVADR
ncbi:hypothetical protein PINS_up002415 [Pythium insidiosum]|nr:hypothetical protein PINS_up002415 [Pythium insidiosum]